MNRWRPIAEAPHGVTLLTRSGCCWVFAGYIAGVWRRDDGKVVQPELWLEET